MTRIVRDSPGLLDRVAGSAQLTGLPIKMRVWLVLFCYADKSGHAWPSRATIAAAAGVGGTQAESTVGKALRALQQDGAIELVKKSKGGRGPGGTSVWLVSPQATPASLPKLQEIGARRLGAQPQVVQTKVGGSTLACDAQGGAIDPRRWGRRFLKVGSSAPPTPGTPTTPTSAMARNGEETSEEMGAPAARGPSAGVLWGVLTEHKMVPSGNPFHLRVGMTRAVEEGMTAEDLQRLCALAKQQGENPIGLLKHWFGVPGRWCSVLAGRGGAGRYVPASRKKTQSAGDVIRRSGT